MACIYEAFLTYKLAKLDESSTEYLITIASYTDNLAFFYYYELNIEFSGQKILYFYLNTQNYKQLYSTLLYLLLNNQFEDKDTTEGMLELFFVNQIMYSTLQKKSTTTYFKFNRFLKCA